MEESLKSQADSRRARLAALREQRNAAKNAGASDLNTSQADPQNVTKDPIDAQSLSISASPTQNKTPTEDYNETLEIPTLEISKFETVEALAAEEQARILSDLNNRAIFAASEDYGDASNGNSSSKQARTSYTNDLKRDIQDYLDIASDKTNIALQKIIHQKFLQVQEPSD